MISDVCFPGDRPPSDGHHVDLAHDFARLHANVLRWVWSCPGLRCCAYTAVRVISSPSHLSFRSSSPLPVVDQSGRHVARCREDRGPSTPPMRGPLAGILATAVAKTMERACRFPVDAVATDSVLRSPIFTRKGGPECPPLFFDLEDS